MAHSKQHPIGDTNNHSASTLAQLNALISDANVKSELRTVNTYTANQTLTTNNDIVICKTNEFTVSLYTAVGNSGKELEIINHYSNVNNITISGTINGVTSRELAPKNSITIFSDGTEWLIK